MDMVGLILRALIFTVLVPGTVTVWLPLTFYNPGRVWSQVPWWIRQLGWIPIALGIFLYLLSALEFLVRGHGTPAIWFTRPLAFVLGLEPQILVRNAIYRYVRNPMYVGVVAILLGEALVFASPNLLGYAVAAWLVFHLVIVFVEEPHLRSTRGPEYIEYCRTTPRWIPQIREPRAAGSGHSSTEGPHA